MISVGCSNTAMLIVLRLPYELCVVCPAPSPERVASRGCSVLRTAFCVYRKPELRLTDTVLPNDLTQLGWARCSV